MMHSVISDGGWLEYRASLPSEIVVNIFENKIYDQEVY